MLKHRQVLFAFTAVLLISALLASCTFVITPEPAAPAAEATAAPVEEATAEPAEEAAVDWTAPEGALVSMPAGEAPVLDGVADESVWADAPGISIDVVDGANVGESVVTLKSVYTGDMVYFLATWSDPTESFLRSPWVKQADGTWGKLKDPDDRGGDNNVYYEDKMAFIWDIGRSIPDFETDGCFTACHEGQNRDVKPYGNKYTDEGMGDIWHWKSVRNLDQIDDQYLDSTKYSPETPEAGRKGDPKEGGGYVNNESEDKTMPMWMGPEGFPRDGSPGYILETEKQPFDDSLFAVGDMVPGITKSQFQGDRGNISAGWKWADGVWTLEFGRPLVTGSEFDVQFDDMGQAYYFGVAIFDNAQVRHAYEDGVSVLVFHP